jgi:hypothetical protein
MSSADAGEPDKMVKLMTVLDPVIDGSKALSQRHDFIRGTSSLQPFQLTSNTSSASQVSWTAQVPGLSVYVPPRMRVAGRVYLAGQLSLGLGAGQFPHSCHGGVTSIPGHARGTTGFATSIPQGASTFLINGNNQTVRSFSVEASPYHCRGGGGTSAADQQWLQPITPFRTISSTTNPIGFEPLASYAPGTAWYTGTGEGTLNSQIAAFGSKANDYTLGPVSTNLSRIVYRQPAYSAGSVAMDQSAGATFPVQLAGGATLVSTGGTLLTNVGSTYTSTAQVNQVLKLVGTGGFDMVNANHSTTPGYTPSCTTFALLSEGRNIATTSFPFNSLVNNSRVTINQTTFSTPTSQIITAQKKLVGWNTELRQAVECPSAPEAFLQSFQGGALSSVAGYGGITQSWTPNGSYGSIVFCNANGDPLSAPNSPTQCTQAFQDPAGNIWRQYTDENGGLILVLWSSGAGAVSTNCGPNTHPSLSGGTQFTFPVYMQLQVNEPLLAEPFKLTNGDTGFVNVNQIGVQLNMGTPGTRPANIFRSSLLDTYGSLFGQVSPLVGNNINAPGGQGQAYWTNNGGLNLANNIGLYNNSNFQLTGYMTGVNGGNPFDVQLQGEYLSGPVGAATPARAIYDFPHWTIAPTTIPAVSGGASFTATSSLLTLDTVPDALVIWCDGFGTQAPGVGAQETSCALGDAMFSLQSVQVNWNNAGPQLIAATPSDLWRRSYQNGVKAPYVLCCPQRTMGSAGSVGRGGYSISGACIGGMLTELGTFGAYSETESASSDGYIDSCNVAGVPCVLLMNKDIVCPPGLAGGAAGSYSLQVTGTFFNQSDYSFTRCIFNVAAVNTQYMTLTAGGMGSVIRTVADQTMVASAPIDEMSSASGRQLVGGGWFDDAKNKGLAMAKKAASKLLADNRDKIVSLAQQHGGSVGSALAGHAADAASRYLGSGGRGPSTSGGGKRPYMMMN